jgi:hypothetical protein
MPLVETASNVIERHHLGGRGSSTKGRCLVGSNDNADDANEKSTGSSVPVLGVCGGIGNGYVADNGNGSLNGWFGREFEANIRS